MYKKFLVQWKRIAWYYKLIGLLVIMGGVSYAYYEYYYSPRMVTIDQKRKQISELEARIAKNQQIIKNLEDFKKQERNLKKILDQTLSLLPRDKEIASLLRTMAYHSQKAGVKILHFTPKGESPRGFYSEIPLELNLSGSYHQIAHLFDRLASMTRLVNVSDIIIGAPIACKDRAVLDVKCIATSFRFIGAGGETSDQEQPTTTTPKKKRQRKRRR